MGLLGLHVPTHPPTHPIIHPPTFLTRSTINHHTPGLNAPIPDGASFGMHPGGWGKPPVDEYGRPLYGDVFGVMGQYGDGGLGEEVSQQPGCGWIGLAFGGMWGSVDSTRCVRANSNPKSQMHAR